MGTGNEGEPGGRSAARRVTQEIASMQAQLLGRLRAGPAGEDLDSFAEAA
jgi:hypothetical protein